MSVTLELTQTQPEAPPRRDLREPDLRSLDGRLQRVNYQRREFTVVAEGRIWSFTLAENCEVWFQGKPAPLRCFHPLDQIRISYESTDGRHVAHALYLWEFFP